METAAAVGGVSAALGLVLLSVPLLLALGLWLVGVPLDWTDWKTYLGLVVLWIAAAIA
ncbi:MAG: hypothetical protein AB1768_19950 [Pseudomonadota bacterium]